MKIYTKSLEEFSRSIVFKEPILPHLANTVQCIESKVDNKVILRGETYYDEDGFAYKVINNSDSKKITIRRFKNAKNQTRKIIEIVQEQGRELKKIYTETQIEYDNEFNSIKTTQIDHKKPWETVREFNIFDKNNRIIYSKRKTDGKPGYDYIIRKSYDEKGRCIYYEDSSNLEESFVKTYDNNTCKVMTLSNNPMKWIEYYDENNLCRSIKYSNGDAIEFEKTENGKSLKKIVNGEVESFLPNRVIDTKMNIYTDNQDNICALLTFKTQIKDGIETDISKLEDVLFDDNNRLLQYKIADSMSREFIATFTYKENTEKDKSMRMKKSEYLKMKKQK